MSPSEYVLLALPIVVLTIVGIFLYMNWLYAQPCKAEYVWPRSDLKTRCTRNRGHEGAHTMPDGRDFPANEEPEKAG